MAIRALHGVLNDWRTTVAATITSGGTSLVLTAPTMGYPATPFKFDIGSERLRCTAISADDPSAGQDTLTVSRGEDDTTAASHFAGAAANQWADAGEATELQRGQTACRALLAAMMGVGVGTDDSGVQETSSGTELKVVAQGTPDMTVDVSPGAGVVSGEPVALLSAYTTAAFVAPLTNPRIDIIQIDQDGDISVKAGSEAGSPSAPAVDTDQMKLAEIYLRVGASAIKNTDDASNGYITDLRVLL